MLAIDNKIRQFLSSPEFAVVGASTDSKSWSNELLRWYEAERLTVYPINPNHEEVDGMPCFKCIADLPSPTTTNLSVITQPSVTLTILQQAQQANIHMVWIQPGAEDADVLDYIRKEGLEDKVIHSTGCHAAMHHQRLKLEFAGTVESHQLDEEDSASPPSSNTKTSPCIIEDDFVDSILDSLNDTSAQQEHRTMASEQGVMSPDSSSTVQKITASAIVKHASVAAGEKTQSGGSKIDGNTASIKLYKTLSATRKEHDANACILCKGSKVLEGLRNASARASARRKATDTLENTSAAQSCSSPKLDDDADPCIFRRADAILKEIGNRTS